MRIHFGHLCTPAPTPLHIPRVVSVIVGKTLWQVATGGTIFQSPVVIQYGGGGDTILYFGQKTICGGSLRWKTDSYGDMQLMNYDFKLS